MFSLAQRVGRAIADHCKTQDELNAVKRTDEEIKAELVATYNRVLKLDGKQSTNALLAAYKRYTHVPKPRNGSAEEEE